MFGRIDFDYEGPKCVKWSEKKNNNSTHLLCTLQYILIFEIQTSIVKIF